MGPAAANSRLLTLGLVPLTWCPFAACGYVRSSQWCAIRAGERTGDRRTQGRGARGPVLKVPRDVCRPPPTSWELARCWPADAPGGRFGRAIGRAEQRRRAISIRKPSCLARCSFRGERLALGRFRPALANGRFCVHADPLTPHIDREGSRPHADRGCSAPACCDQETRSPAMISGRNPA